MIKNNLIKAISEILRDVCLALGKRERDQLACEIPVVRVFRTKANATDDPFATFIEWKGEADRDAYVTF